MVIVEGRCTMARSSSFRSKLLIGWHKSIVSSDWSDTMVWFGQILLYFNYYHPIYMILVLHTTVTYLPRTHTLTRCEAEHVLTRDKIHFKQSESSHRLLLLSCNCHFSKDVSGWPRIIRSMNYQPNYAPECLQSISHSHPLLCSCC